MSEIGTKFLETAEARMKELQPQVQEYNELEVEVARFKGQSPNGDNAPPAATPSPAAPATGGRRGRRRNGGGNTREDEAMALITKAGAEGITIPEMAKEMGLANSNYLYRVTANLLENKMVKKDGQRFISA